MSWVSKAMQYSSEVPLQAKQIVNQITAQVGLSSPFNFAVKTLPYLSTVPQNSDPDVGLIYLQHQKVKYCSFKHIILELSSSVLQKHVEVNDGKSSLGIFLYNKSNYQLFSTATLARYRGLQFHQKILRR